MQLSGSGSQTKKIQSNSRIPPLILNFDNFEGNSESVSAYQKNIEASIFNLTLYQRKYTKGGYSRIKPFGVSVKM